MHVQFSCIYLKAYSSLRSFTCTKGNTHKGFGCFFKFGTAMQCLFICHLMRIWLLRAWIHNASPFLHARQNVHILSRMRIHQSTTRVQVFTRAYMNTRSAYIRFHACIRERTTRVYLVTLQHHHCHITVTVTWHWEPKPVRYINVYSIILPVIICTTVPL
jgi:hypothetical protein